MLKRILQVIRARQRNVELPAQLVRRVAQDHRGLPLTDPGIENAISACLTWLCRGQDMSLSGDGGVARHYGYLGGWSASYPETTGYIVPTFLEQARIRRRVDLKERAERMLRWLCTIQLGDGGFQGGAIGDLPIAPVHFNTGQILLGLVAGQREFGSFGGPLRQAADWLVSVQDADGCWRRFQSPFAVKGDKTYYTHVAWGLLEAERVDPGRGYAESAMANIAWALTRQHRNGWFDNCCLSDFDRPLTHTIGYTLKGIVEGYRFSGESKLLDGAVRTADGLIGAMRSDGFLPGCLGADWSAAADWSCLTGTAQVAECLLILSQCTGEKRFYDAGKLANLYVRRTISVTGDPDTLGGVRGSFPIDGGYCRYAYPSWAAKFLIDSLSLEAKLGA